MFYFNILKQLIENQGPSLEVEVSYASFFGQEPIPLSPNQADGCNSLLFGSCPYKSGQLIIRRSTITIPDNVPTGIQAPITATYSSPCGPVACATIYGYAADDGLRKKVSSA